MFHRLVRIPRRYLFCIAAAILVTALATGIRLKQLAVPTAGENDLRGYLFVLDAGHGGEDGGASTQDGVLESEINLAITLKLDDLLHLLGQKTVLVRRTDTAIYSPGSTTYAEKKVSDLRNRVALVNETPNAFLVSIHQNQFEQSKYSGAQVFYNNTAPAQETAKILQEHLISALDPDNHRQAKSAVDTVFLMREINAPGVLVECGFLSNPQEAQKLQQPEYQTKLALVIASALNRLSPKEIQENEI